MEPNHHHLLLKISIPLSFLLLLSTLLTCSLADDHHHLLSCLNSHGVNNYTTPSDDSGSEYNRFLYLSMQNPLFERPTFRKPSAILIPGSKQQLSSSILCSRKSSLTIRLRSGGHSYEGLSYTADTPFVIIDLMNLNKISIDLESETAWVETGATLGEVYYSIAKSTDSLGFTAGWCPTVGSGGHISGGGFGMMSRKYGLAADNVIVAILIDANGEILDRKSMGEDVFWAIRGGGGGVWGAIYAWKIQLLPVPKTVTVYNFKKHFASVDEASNLLHKWQSVAIGLEDDYTLSILGGAAENQIWLMVLGLYLGPKTDAISTMEREFPELGLVEEQCLEMSWGEAFAYLTVLGAAENQIWLMVLGLYLGPKTDAISTMEREFPELGLVEEQCLEMSWGEAFAYLAGVETVDEMNDRFRKFDDRAFKTKVDFAKEVVPLDGFKGLLERLMKEHRGFIALNAMGGMMSRISSEATPFPHRNGTLLMLEFIVAWNKDEDSNSDEYLGWLDEVSDYMGEFVSHNPRVGYVNHVDLDLGGLDWSNSSDSRNAIEIARSWGEKYFLKNYDRLVKAKTLIDPNNVFHHPQSIPPLQGLDLNQIWGSNVEEKNAMF